MITEKDRKILEIIRSRKATTKEISLLTGIPITTVHNRIKKMEREGVIKGYRAIIDNKKIGNEIEVIIGLEFARGKDGLEKISRIPNVEECYKVSGSFDAIVKAAFRNIEELNQFLDELKKINVERTVTHIVLKRVK